MFRRSIEPVVIYNGQKILQLPGIHANSSTSYGFLQAARETTYEACCAEALIAYAYQMYCKQVLGTRVQRPGAPTASPTAACGRMSLSGVVGHCHFGPQAQEPDGTACFDSGCEVQ